MKLPDLTQPPFETTLMGVVRAVADHFGSTASDAVIYGGTGHAFLINLHEALCPSSPYCWKFDGLYPLLENLGISMTDLGFFHGGTPPEERAALERKLRDHLDAGRPCSLCNMDHQVIYGYEDGAFLTARPWPKNPDYPAGTLTFGAWPEFGEEVHANFFVFKKRERADDRKVFTDSLRYALDLARHPERYEFERYAIGPRAYDHWAAAAEEHGASHGNWWNGTVWAECRSGAAAYFEEMAGSLPAKAGALASGLSASYGEIAERLRALSEKELEPTKKVALATDLGERERAALGRIEDLLAAI